MNGAEASAHRENKVSGDPLPGAEGLEERRVCFVLRRGGAGGVRRRAAGTGVETLGWVCGPASLQQGVPRDAEIDLPRADERGGAEEQPVAGCGHV